jgi:hypothetical protein
MLALLLNGTRGRRRHRRHLAQPQIRLLRLQPVH